MNLSNPSTNLTYGCLRCVFGYQGVVNSSGYI